MGARELKGKKSNSDAITIGGYNNKLQQENPSHAEGYYKGIKTYDNLADPTDPYTQYILVTKEGKTVPVWAGRTELDNKMAEVQLGEYVTITYTGRAKNKKGTGSRFTYKVTADETDTNLSLGSVDDGTEADEEGDETEDSNAGYEAPTAPPVAARSNKGSNKANVDAMLAKKGKV